jgi:hypothetical protein
VVAPADAVHVGEEAHELLPVRQERAPRRAVYRRPVRGGGGVDLGLPDAALGHTTVAGLVVEALARTSRALGLRRRRQREEHEPLLAVAAAAADDELADAAPPRDGPRGPALPPPPRGAGCPQAVALRRRAAQPSSSFLLRRRRGAVARARLLQEEPPQLPPLPWRRGGMMMMSGLLRRRGADGGVAEERRVGGEGPDAAVREQLVGRHGGARGGVPTDEGELELLPSVVVGLLVSVIVRRGLLWLRLAGALLLGGGGGAGAFLLVSLHGGCVLHFVGARRSMTTKGSSRAGVYK